jgi:hypothetical protein
MSALAITSPVALPDALTVWKRLMAAYDAAKAADDDINARYDAAAAAHEADKPAEPDVNMVLLFGVLLGRCDIARRRLLYRDDLDELQRQILAAKGVTRWERIDRDPERIAELDKLREYRRLIAESEQRHGISALDDEWAEAGKRLADARTALLLAPAPDYAAVRWKLDQLFGPEATGSVSDEERSAPCWDAVLTDAVIADMDRLGGAA